MRLACVDALSGRDLPVAFGEDRRQGVLLPEFLDDCVSEENPVRVIDVYVDVLDLGAPGFAGVVSEAAGRRPSSKVRGLVSAATK